MDILKSVEVVAVANLYCIYNIAALGLNFYLKRLAESVAAIGGIGKDCYSTIICSTLNIAITIVHIKADVAYRSTVLYNSVAILGTTCGVN